MDSFFDDPFRFFDGKALAEFNTDIIERGNYYILEADLPGFEKGDVNELSRFSRQLDIIAEDYRAQSVQ